MRIPGLKSRKSSTNAIAQDDHHDDHQQQQHQHNSERPNLKASTSSSFISLSRWKSHGSTSNVEQPPPVTASTSSLATSSATRTTEQQQQQQQPAKLTKRSLFGRTKSHSRSLSIPEDVNSSSSINTHHDDDIPPPPSNVHHPATISAASASGLGGHPLRQQTLPIDLLKSPPLSLAKQQQQQQPTSNLQGTSAAASTSSASKRPGLSLPRRSLGLDRSFFSSTPSTTTSDHGHGHGHGAGDGHHSSGPSHMNVRSSTLPLPYRDSPASKSSESFQLKSFRAVSGVREEPTLISLVDAELTHSPLSTRPNSPTAVPASPSSTSITGGGGGGGGGGLGSHSDTYGPYGSSSSYFDPRQPTAISKGERSPASISVSRFREARAARSTSSLGSTANQGSAYPTPGGGLNLDLPPPITLEYSPRPSLNLSQPDLRASTSGASINSPSSPTQQQYLLNEDSFASSNALSRISSTSPTKESFATATHTLHAADTLLVNPSSPTSLHSATFDERSSAHSHNTQGHVHPLAYHPDNALPLPPVPVDPEKHARRSSNQSISSLSAALGGWLNSATSGMSLPTLVDDVQKSFHEQTANLRSRPLSLKDELPGQSAKEQTASPRQASVQHEVAHAPSVHLAPTQEELHKLLGGKVLPPPPSETGHDYDPSAVQSSPKTPLSRNSSFSNINLGFAKNLFASGIFKAARPAKDDDDDDSDESHNEVLALSSAREQDKAVSPRHSPAKPSLRPSHAFDTSSASDSEVSENESDDTDEQEKKRQKALVFPPPRPKSQADRERIYKAALTPPTLTPSTSHSDLRQFAQLPVQPMPRVTALTLENVRDFNGESSDDDEDVPLSTIRLKAQSEMGLRSASASSSRGRAMAQSSISKTIPVPPLSKAYAQSNLNISRGPRTSIGLPVPPKAASSIGMPRSLSAFSTASSDVSAAQKNLPSRSASSHAIPNLASSGLAATTSRPQITLSSLIESELSKTGGDARLPESLNVKSASTISRPSSSSIGSYPKTPSDISEAPKGKSTLITFDQEPSQASTVGRSTRTGKRSTIGDFGLLGADDLNRPVVISSDIGISRHTKSQSTPFAVASSKSNGSVTDQMKARHREEARKSGLMPLVGRSELGHASAASGGSTQAFAGYPGPTPLSPHSLQAMPPPPGVDMALYASLPNDQKLALHMRSQQLMAMMQNFALQAQQGGLEALPPAGSLATGTSPPFGGGNMSMPMSMPHMMMPAGMQMPMMGSNLPSFPTNLGFFGAPTFFPGMPMPTQPPLPGSLSQPQQTPLGGMGPYVGRAPQAFSAIGLPTAHQQAHRNQNGRQN